MMATLAIHHLIYTRVEPEYSPTRSNGFQTVLCSHAIWNEAAELEARVQCFVPSQTPGSAGAVEHQFFWTKAGYAAVVRTGPIEPDPQVIDAARGRTGHFIAHALVLDKAAFAAVGNDPFALLEAAEQADIFATGVKTLVHYLRRAPPPERLRAARRTRLHERLPGWHGAAARQLAEAACASPVFAAHHKTLLLVSRYSERIYAFLSATLFLTDGEHRVGCSFHTAVEGCPQPPGAYWAVGARRTSHDPAFSTIDLDVNSWVGRTQQRGTRASPYLAWLRQAPASCIESPAGTHEIYTAQVAAECLAARRALPAEPLADSALLSFWGVNHKRYESGQKKALVSALGRPIGERLAKTWLAIAGIRHTLDTGATEELDAARYAPAIHAWIVREHNTIRAWTSILRFAHAAQFAPLLAIAAAKAPAGILRGNRNAILRAGAVDQLTRQGELAQWLPDLQTVLPAHDYVTATSAPAVAAGTEPEGLTDAVFVDLAAVLIQHGAALLDERYARRARRLENRAEAKRLLKLLRAAGGTNGAMSTALRSVR